MLKKVFVQLFAVLALISASGCATVVSSGSQKINVKTTAQGQEVKGARCELKNDKGAWKVVTPASVEVGKAFGELNLLCKKPGFEDGTLVVKSSTSGSNFGNLILGGAVGFIVDAKSGNGYKYPELLTVELGVPVATTSSAATTRPVAAP